MEIKVSFWQQLCMITQEDISRAIEWNEYKKNHPMRTAPFDFPGEFIHTVRNLMLAGF